MAKALFSRRIETRDLVLRPYRVSDAEQMFRALTTESLRLCEILAPPVLALKNVEDTEGLIATLEEDWCESRQLIISIWDRIERTLVGECYLGGFQPATREAEIGIFLLAPFEGRGFAYQALRACIQEAARALPFDTLKYRCDADNQRSISLACRCGFQETAARTAVRVTKDGRAVPTLLFTLDLIRMMI